MSHQGSLSQEHSYDFDAFTDADRQAELKRLYLQATLFQEREVAYLRLQGLMPGMKALEVGSGPGFVTGMLAAIVERGEAHGVDNSEELIAVANEVVGSRFPNTRFFKGDAYDSGLPAASYDFVYNRLIYQHLKNPVQALQEARRLLRPGGKVCVVDVDAGFQFIEPDCIDFNRLNELSCLAQLKIGGDRYIGRKLPHYLKEAGFCDIKLELISVSSLDTDLKLLLGITTKFKALQVATPEARELMHRVEEFCSKKDFPPLVLVAMFGAVGTV